MSDKVCVLLLPCTLEAFASRERADDLLRADGVVAVEPARLSYGAFARIPDVIADAMASLQARRLHRALPAPPAVVVLFDALGYPLARGIIAAEPRCQLWYGRTGDGPPVGTRRACALDEQAAERSAFTFDPAPDSRARERNDPLWERLRALGVDTRVSR